MECPIWSKLTFELNKKTTISNSQSHPAPQAGNYLRDDTVSSTIQIVSAAPLERQAYAAMRLWTALELVAESAAAGDKQPLVQVRGGSGLLRNDDEVLRVH